MVNSIGVVIPCRNYAHFLSDALRSLAAQDMPLRVVIVNDGGTDGPMLEALAETFRTRDLSVDVIHMPTARGVGLARNTGAAYLNTDFYLFLDADDWLHAGAVDALRDGLRRDTTADFTYGDYTQHGQTIRTFPWAMAETLLHERNIASYCHLWRRASFWALGGYSGVPTAEDWELQRRAYDNGLTGRHVDAVIFEHRLHDKNKWTHDALVYGGLAGVSKVLEDYER